MVPQKTIGRVVVCLGVALSPLVSSCQEKEVKITQASAQPEKTDEVIEVNFGEGLWCEWMSFDDFQTYCDEKFGAKKSISEVEGSLEDGKNMFRAKFHELPYELFSFYAHWGANKKNFETSHAEYTKYGYRLHFQQTYQDDIGKTRYQAIWVED